MVLELGLCKQDKTYVKTFSSIGWRNLISLPLKQRRHFGPLLWEHGSHKRSEKESLANSSPMMVCQLLSKGVCANFSPMMVYQLLANHECANSSPMMVCQFLSNEVCANSSLKGCVPASCQ
jgi:hypothetical protein